MNVVFTAVDEFLAELAAVKANSSIVRVQTEEVDLALAQQMDGEHRGSGIQFVVVSGFHDDKYFYQGMFDCGIVHGRSDKEQREASAAVVEKIRQACASLGLEVRGGLWHRS